MKTWLAFLVLGLGACSSESPAEPSEGANADAGAAEGGPTDAAAAPDVAVGARCAATFGDALKGPFGRIDGTLLAIVSPGNESCAMPNSDHVIVQVSMNGAAYRMVVNVESNRGNESRVYVRPLAHALPAPAFAEGWHTDAALDYVTTLGVHSTDPEWAPQDIATLVATIEDAVVLDETVSVYASTDGGASAHLVHRNRQDRDGALVLGASSNSPRWLLFHFDEQSF